MKELKTCKTCRKAKPIDCFYRHPATKDRLCQSCNQCSTEYSRQYNLAHPEKTREHDRHYRKTQPERVRESRRRYYETKGKEKRNTARGRLVHAISTAINHSLKKNKQGCHWEGIVGYTTQELTTHLERQFRDGMNWENYGFYGWHIDHIKPIASFHFNSPNDKDFNRCWALENLQPLWAIENKIKNAKVF